jgi:hypothetical protein
MKKKGRRKSSNSSFNPNTISIGLYEALKRDLDGVEHVYAPTPVAAFYRDVQLRKFLSKFASDSDIQDQLHDEAFLAFRGVNDQIAKVNESFRLPDLAGLPVPDDVGLTLRRARMLAHFVLTPLSEDEWFYGCKSSTGSSIGVPYANTSPERKYTYPLSVSDGRLIPLWHRYRLFHPEFARSIDALNSKDVLVDEFAIVVSSRATTVEKSNSARRMIAVEPTVNMFFQQGLMNAMVRRLQAIGLDITSVPDVHRQKAYVNSIIASEDTIDFSHASDCVSKGFLEWLLPPSWYSKLDLVRCRSMFLGDDNVELEMISTMGNATTFPIETLVFWCIAVSAMYTVSEPNTRSLLPNWKYFSSCSVFGDDCITPSSSTDLFMRSTEAVGFIVNHDKSFFNGGYFRESCGGDFYRGCNVRPVFLRSPSSTKRSALEPWLYSFFNSIIQKYISYFGSVGYVYDKELFRFLFRTFNRSKILVKIVPDWFPDDAGLKIGEDFFRFQRAYDFSCSRISRDEHGTYRFSYCRFRYRHKHDWDDWLRYSLYKKAKLSSFSSFLRIESLYERSNPYVSLFSELPSNFSREQQHKYPIRRLGGYVVATAYTASWSPNFG